MRPIGHLPFLSLAVLLTDPTSARFHHQQRSPVASGADLSTYALANISAAIAAINPDGYQANTVTPALQLVNHHSNARAKKLEATREAAAVERKKKKSKCPVKKAKATTSTTSASSSETIPAIAVKAVVAAAVIVKDIPKTPKPTTTSTEPASTTTPSSSSSGSGKGLIGFDSSNCGPSGATSKYPNGAQNFLNCGVNGGGWTPPKGVTLNKLATVSIEHALASNNIWAPCKPYVSLFEKYGAAYNLPPILLAAFALQESTCQADTLGDNGGAFGLMQITQDKCGGQGASGCAEPDYNIKTAAKYFADTLSENGGDFLTALGAYNGWYVGLTYAAATAAASGDCCECQNNLDYLFQMVNGWMIGDTGYNLGSVGNLDSCPNQ